MSPSSGHRPVGSDFHAVVVGGGVIGVCCAYYLARRGVRVTVLERDELGRGASYGNAGLISPGHPSINRPGRVRQALASLAKPLSPLYFAPRWDPSLVRWLWAFSRYCSEEHRERSMKVLAPLGHETLTLVQQLRSEEELECGYRPCGYYEIFVTEAGLAAAGEEAALTGRHGFAPEALGGSSLREREPALSESVRGGFHHPEGIVVDPYRFVLEVAERARRRGAVLRERSEVAEVDAERGRVHGVRLASGESLEADAVVVATGAYSPSLMAGLGCPLPVQPAKGYHRDRDPKEGGAPLLENACLLGESSVFCAPLGDVVRFAGTLEFSGINHDMRRPRLEQLTRAAARYMSGVGDAPSRSEWCGLRPCTPDGLPVVGRVPGTMGAFVATGHAMLGLTLGPVTGKLIAELVLDAAPSLDVSALRADRFQRRRG